MLVRRFDPFTEVRRMQENMDHARGGFSHPTSGSGEMEGWAIPLDVVKGGENFLYRLRCLESTPQTSV